MRKLLPVVLVALLSSVVIAQTYTQDFERDLGGAKSYHSAPDELPIERVADGDNHFARVATPGKKALEGFYVVASGLEGARVATASAKVRGKGELWLCLLSGNGWLYSPKVTALTGQWQEVSLAKALSANDKALSVYFITQKAQPGAVFEVDDVKVAQGPAPEAWETEVSPWRLEAEDFAQRNRTVKADQTGSGGKVVGDEQYAALTGLPFPRTSKALTIYARVRPQHAKDQFRVSTTLGGNTQYVASLSGAKVNEWQWLRFPPLVAGEVGDSFGFVLQREKGTAGEAAIDAVVLATSADLTDEQLAAAPALFGTRPMAAVGPAQAPTLDGDLSDPAWLRAVACSNFSVVGSTLPPQADTLVRVCHDEQNLYLAFDCPEPILDTAQQRRHEFLAKVTARDGDVYNDDSVVMLLQPPGSTHVCDFTVNSLGTIADAVCTGPDLWGSRDVKWNSGARAVGKTDERRWTVEVSIPLSDLGAKAAPGETWRACFGRIAKARKETSSWNLSDKGFHDPVELGALVFEASTPGLTIHPPTSLQPLGNELLLSLNPPASVYAVSEIQGAAGIRHETQLMIAEGVKALTQRLDLAGESDVRLGHAVLDAASLRPIAMTPLVSRSIKASSATLTLATAGPYELFLNDEVIARGASADGSEIKLPLQKGPNVLALRLEQGTAALALDCGGTIRHADQWKLASADSQKAGARLTDDSALPKAPVVSRHATLGAMVGEAGKPVVLRHTLLFEQTRVWPTPEPAFYLARGPAQHFTLIVDGFKHRKLPGWTTYVATPLDYEIIGATGFYGVRATQPVWSCEQLGEKKVDGKTVRVVKITADKPVLAAGHPIMAQLEVFARYREAAGEPKSAEATFAYWSEADGGAVSEPLQSFKVRLLPKLDGAQCKTFTWQLWGGWLSNMDDLKLREEVLCCSQASGFNDIVGGDRWASDNAPRYGLKHTLGTNFKPWCIDLAPYLKEHPDQRLIAQDGKADDALMCMTMLLGEGWKAAEEGIKVKLDAIRPNTYDYDYEYSPYNGPHSCYCPRCLAAFRQFAKLPADTPLTPEVIRKTYSAQWVDFMCLRVAQMFAKFKETTHRLSPGTLFSAYSGYQTEDNPERYGVDWRHVGQLQAVDRAGCGYGRPLEGIKATVEGLKGLPLIGGALVVPYETSVTSPQTPLNKGWLLRVLLDSPGGVLVYDRLTIDGRSWYAMAETTRLVAEYEQVFLKGKHSPIAGVDESQGAIVSDGKMTLVCVMNQSGKAATHRLTLPQAATAVEYYSKAKVTPGQALEVTVEPGEAVVYVLK